MTTVLESFCQGKKIVICMYYPKNIFLFTIPYDKDDTGIRVNYTQVHQSYTNREIFM